MRQEGMGQGIAIRGITQQLAPRWWRIQIPIDLEAKDGGRFDLQGTLSYIIHFVMY